MNDITLTQETMLALRRRNLHRCTFADIGTISPIDNAEDITKADEFLREANAHLRYFLKPHPEGRCVLCDRIQGGGLPELLTGGLAFTWGIVHGEGYCRECGYPARGLHYLKDADGRDLVTLHIILQYHPDELMIRGQG